MRNIAILLMVFCSQFCRAQNINRPADLKEVHTFLSKSVRFPKTVNSEGFVIARFSIAKGKINQPAILFSDNKGLSQEVLRIFSLPVDMSAWMDSTVILVPFNFYFEVDHDSKMAAVCSPVHIDSQVFAEPVSGIMLPVVICRASISYCPLPEPRKSSSN